MIWRKGKPPAEVEEKPRGFDDYDLRLGDLMRGERATLGKSLLDVQRELKIKATYIAAIENADVSAFQTPGFVAGYVRSYARYLGMDPDKAYQQFCIEADFSATPTGLATARVNRALPSSSRPRPKGLEALGDPDAMFVRKGESWTSRIEPGAAGSVLVLLLLIGGIGYGGWSMLREVQRVQVSPIEQAPAVVASIDPLGNVGAGTTIRVTEGVEPVTPAPTMEAIGRLYRPQALDVPQMVSRDGPIGSILPKPSEDLDASVAAALAMAAEGQGEDTPVRVLAEAAPAVEIVAVSPAWVRVRAVDGTVLFEKILDKGETYVVPQSETPPTLRAGNSGAIYFMVKGQAYGPASPGAQVVSNVALSPEALTDKYALADLETKPELRQVVELMQERLIGGAPAQE